MTVSNLIFNIIDVGVIKVYYRMLNLLNYYMENIWLSLNVRS